MTFLSLACFVMNASGAAGELKRDNPWKLSAYVKANSLLRSSPRIEMRLPGIKTWGGGEQEWEEGGKKKKTKKPVTQIIMMDLSDVISFHKKRL